MAQLNNIDEYERALKNNEKCVFRFTAKWCGPCKRIEPTYLEYEKKFNNIKFFTIDIDKIKGIGEKEQFRSIPFFSFYRKQNRMFHFTGADTDKLKTCLMTLSSI